MNDLLYHLLGPFWRRIFFDEGASKVSKIMFNDFSLAIRDHIFVAFRIVNNRDYSEGLRSCRMSAQFGKVLSMTEQEELEQVRQEHKVLREALQRKDKELEQSQQANQDLREGLKQAIMALGSQQEHMKDLEGLIAALQERVKTLER